jgi:hypothetical protein
MKHKFIIPKYKFLLHELEIGSRAAGRHSPLPIHAFQIDQEVGTSNPKCLFADIAIQVKLLERRA